MMTQPHGPAAPLAYEFRSYLEWPSCPRCGETLVAPDTSILVGRGHIRHQWSCEDCGYEFETAVRLPPASRQFE